MIDDGGTTQATANTAVELANVHDASGSFFWYFLREAAWVTCVWLAVYGGVNWITSLHSYRVRLWTDFDLSIPFIPAAAGVYLSIFPMLWIAPLFRRTREELHSLARALTWLILFSGIGFLLLPGDHGHSQPAPAGFNGALFNVADQINMSYNYLPSLHVGMAIVCAFAYSQCVSRRWGVVFWLWAAAIAASTLVTHQHYIADVVTGGALGYLFAAIFMPRRL
jgi:membrane-associated phospholipid phosphatase